MSKGSPPSSVRSIPPTNATSSSTTTIFWCEYLKRTHESVSAWMFVPRVKTFMYDSTSRLVGWNTGSGAPPTPAAERRSARDVRQQVAQHDGLLLAREVELGREAPAEEMDVRSRAGDRLRDGREGTPSRRRAPRRGCRRAARTRRRPRKPELAGIECVLPAHFPKPPPVGSTPPTRRPRPPGDRPRRDLQLPADPRVVWLAHGLTLTGVAATASVTTYTACGRTTSRTDRGARRARARI